MKKSSRFFALALTLCLLLSLAGCSSKDYEAATKLMEAGSYAEAKAAFTALGSYKDSAEQLTACDYELAIELYESGDYRAAMTAFDALNGYGESAEYLADATTAYVSEQLPGRWITAELDFSGLMSESIRAGMGDDEDVLSFLEYLDLSFYTGRLVLEFTDDNTVLFSQDEELATEKLQQLIKELGNAYVSYMVDMLQEVYGAEGISLDALRTQLGATDDESLVRGITQEIFGTDLDGIIEQIFPMDTLKELLSLKQTGTYSVSGTSVQLTVDGDKQIYTFNLEDDTLSGAVSELKLDSVVFARLS